MAVEGDPIVRSMRERFSKSDPAVPLILEGFAKAKELVDRGDFAGAVNLLDKETYIGGEVSQMVAREMFNEGRHRELEEFGNLSAEALLAARSSNGDYASEIYIMMGRARLARWEDPRNYFDKAIKATEYRSGVADRVPEILKMAEIMEQNSQDPGPYIDKAIEIVDSVDLSEKDTSFPNDGCLDLAHKILSYEDIAKFQTEHGLLDDAEKTLQKLKDLEEFGYDPSDMAELIKKLEEAREKASAA